MQPRPDRRRLRLNQSSIRLTATRAHRRPGCDPDSCANPGLAKLNFRVLFSSAHFLRAVINVATGPDVDELIGITFANRYLSIDPESLLALGHITIIGAYNYDLFSVIGLDVVHNVAQWPRPS